MWGITQTATYSASMESAIQNYLTLLELIAPPPKVNTT